MSDSLPLRLTMDDLEAEGGQALPAKEVISLLDLNVNLDLMLDVAAPIDLAVAANANVAAPIDAAVAANVLSDFSSATAVADQDAVIAQSIDGVAIADAPQTSLIDQSAEPVETPPVDPVVEPEPTPTEPAGLLDGPLLNLDVDLALDADLAAPIAGAVALNANVAAPIDAAVAANVLSTGSSAVAVADQDVIIVQNLDDVVARATAEQDSEIIQ